MKMTTCLILAGLTVVSVSGPLRAGEGGKVDILVTKNKHIDFVIGDKLAGRYHIAPTVAKPYFWPLNAPGEVPVTRAWPMEKGKPGESVDHKHQKSAWFCHGDVIPEGMELKIKVKGVKGVDFWSEAEGHGKIVCTEVGGSSGREGQARVTTKNEWRTADGTKILDETRTLRLYDLRKARLFVLDIDLHASVVPITFGDTKEGAMGVRVNDTIREQKGNGQMRNAEGRTSEKECWGQFSPWCDYSGTIDGKKAGIAIFDDPKNPHPVAWHSRGYGLMAANPFGRSVSKFPAVKGRNDLVRLTKGEHLRLRYGILVHAGDTTEAQVAEQFKRFVKLRGGEQ